MKYMNMKAEEITEFFRKFQRDPYPCYFNMQMRNDGKILIARAAGDDLGALPDKFVPVSTFHHGGSILGYPDSICLVAFEREKPLWMENLTEFLRLKGLNAEHTGNDILVDGYKVAGFAATPLHVNGIVYFTFFVSFTVDLNDVLQVCKKPMKKIPAGLNKYGISRDEVLSYLGVEV